MVGRELQSGLRVSELFDLVLCFRVQNDGLGPQLLLVWF